VEGILVSQIMAEIDLIKNLEKISFMFPNRLLKLQGYLLRDDSKEFLEIIIYKGFSSSTTHQTEIDPEKKVIKFDHFFTKFILFRAPLTRGLEDIIRENKNSHFFLNQKSWI
tara:strand:- start:178 stop:513 length:336 start_codon:yes stop_codon:yes gene_type:complete